MGDLIDTLGPPIHIAGGVAALVAVPVALGAAKGGLWHRRAGQTFFWGMTAVFLTAMAMGLRSNDLILVLVAIFSYYLVVSGYRALYLKRPATAVGAAYRAGPIDHGAAQFTLVCCAILLAWGLATVAENPMAPVIVVFGGIGVWLALADLRRFRRNPRDRSAWLFAHAVRMMAGAIAAVTAVVVVNVPDLPSYVRWLGPTLVGTVAIVVMVVHWRRRLADGTPVERLVEVRIVDPSKEAS